VRLAEPDGSIVWRAVRPLTADAACALCALVAGGD